MLGVILVYGEILLQTVEEEYLIAVPSSYNFWIFMKIKNWNRVPELSQKLNFKTKLVFYLFNYYVLDHGCPRLPVQPPTEP